MRVRCSVLEKRGPGLPFHIGQVELRLSEGSADTLTAFRGPKTNQSVLLHCDPRKRQADAENKAIIGYRMNFKQACHRSPD